MLAFFFSLMLVLACNKPESTFQIAVLGKEAVKDSTEVFCEGCDGLIVLRVINGTMDTIFTERPPNRKGTCYFPSRIAYFEMGQNGKLLNKGVAVIDVFETVVFDTINPGDTVYFADDKKYLMEQFDRANYVLYEMPYVFGGKRENRVYYLLMHYDSITNSIITTHNDPNLSRGAEAICPPIFHGK